ncbi:MAG: hypothetical protein LBM25_02905 [Bacteroidales bacterium]|jgi:hypothetical protein|nr:hypothetical protein [Bacteroidales bacterium]
MKKPYFITIVVIIAIMLSINISFLIYYQQKLDKDIRTSLEDQKIYHRERDEKKYDIANLLSLDEDQKAEYEYIVKQHNKIASRAIDSLHTNQKILMSLLRNDSKDEGKNEYIENQIILFQRILLNEHSDLYKEVKKIIRPEQMKLFNSVFEDIFVCKPSCEHDNDACASHKSATDL